MKITLIYPKVSREKPLYTPEPMGLGYVAAYLKTKGYLNVAIKNSTFDDDVDIISDAAHSNIVGISATSFMMIHGRELASKIKAKNKDVKIVFGGVHPTVCPETTLEDKNIDIVCRGEGELTFYELVITIDEGKNLDNVKGISYRQNDKIIHNPDRVPIPDLDMLPYPDRNAMRQGALIKIYSRNYGKRGVLVFTGRGCPFSCTYCAAPMLGGRHVRRRSPENVIDEIKMLKKQYKIKHVDFLDETFTFNKTWVLKFCDLLQREAIGISWACFVHPNTADKEMFIKMKESGCKEVEIGVESGSPEILKELKRNYTPEDIKSLFSMLRKLKMKTRAFAMGGLPSESKETIRQTEALIQEIKPDVTTLFLFIPIPGSELYQSAKEAGYVEDNMDWSDIEVIHRRHPPSKFLSREELLEEAKMFNKRLYSYTRRNDVTVSSLIATLVNMLKTYPVKRYPHIVMEFFKYIIRIESVRKSV